MRLPAVSQFKAGPLQHTHAHSHTQTHTGGFTPECTWQPSLGQWCKWLLNLCEILSSSLRSSLRPFVLDSPGVPVLFFIMYIRITLVIMVANNCLHKSETRRIWILPTLMSPVFDLLLSLTEVNNIPEHFLRAFSSCLYRTIFSTVWDPLLCFVLFFKIYLLILIIPAFVLPAVLSVCPNLITLMCLTCVQSSWLLSSSI